LLCSKAMGSAGSAGCFAFPSGLCISTRHAACKVDSDAREEAICFLQKVQASRRRSLQHSEALGKYKARKACEEAFGGNSSPTEAIATSGRIVPRKGLDDSLVLREAKCAAACRLQQKAEDDDRLELQAFLQFLDDVKSVELTMPID